MLENPSIFKCIKSKVLKLIILNKNFLKKRKKEKKLQNFPTKIYFLSFGLV